MSENRNSINLPVALEKVTDGVQRLIGRTIAIADMWSGGNRHDGPEIASAKRPIFIGTMIILVAFVGFGLWAAIAPIGSAVIAPGVVAVETGRQTIQHLEGGIIKQILVSEGSEVKVGDPLIRLEGTRAHAELALVEGQFFLAQANQGRLLAERDGLDKPLFPLELRKRAETDPTVADIVAGQTNLFNARAAVVKGQVGILRQQIAQYQKQIEGYQSIEESKRSQLKLTKTELADLSSLLEDGYVTKSRVLALQREEAQLQGERGQALAEISRAEQGIGEANQHILQIENQRREDVSKDLHATEGQLDDLAQRRIATQDVVARLDIQSPMNGTVANLAVHTIGGVISPSMPMMEIVPNNNKLVVEAEVNPRDIDTIKIGDQVALRVSTADARLTPVIYGRLDEISRDRTPMSNNSRGAYKVRISIPPNEIARLGDAKLHVGMQVEALVSSGSQTALHYALKPMLDGLAKSFRER